MTSLLGPTLAYTGVWTTNTAACTLSGTLTYTVNSAATSTWLSVSAAVAVNPDEVIYGVLDLAGSGVAGNYQMWAVFNDAAGAQIGGSIRGQAVTAGASVSATVTATAPAGTAAVRLYLGVGDGTVAGRVIRIVAASYTRKAAADDVISVAFERDLARTAEVSGAGTLVLAQGPIGPRTGTVVYLCSTLAASRQIDALYRSGGPIKVDDINVPDHHAIGRLRAASEKALPGVAARWLVTVPIQEVN